MLTRFLQCARIFSIGAFFLLMFWEVSAQKNPKTFLYRINGPGTSGESYLMGTIHLKDARVFDSPDSMYKAIENCSVFAMEIHPDSLTERVVEYSVNGKKEKYLKDLLDPATMARLKKKYQKGFSTPMEKMTLLELMQTRRGSGKSKTPPSTEQMPTFMDMYLMDLAASAGKEVIGLERVDDQLDMMVNITRGEDPERLLTGLLGDAATLPALVSAYIERDMDKVQAFVNGMPAYLEELVLSKRNKVMLDGMKKQMQQGPVFTAVGAAHLPGKNGLIQLLQQEGFTLLPVLSPNNLHASKYKPLQAPVEKSWESIESPENGYRLQMPGKPAKTEIQESGIPMFTYVDWKRSEQYFFVHVPAYAPINKSNEDSMVQEMLNNSLEEMNGVIIEPLRSIKVGTKNGWSAMLKGSDRLYYHLSYFLNGQDIFLLMNGVENRDSLQNERMKKFRNSLEIVPKVLSAFKTFQDTEAGFEMALPGTAVVKEKEDKEANPLTLSKQYYLRQGASEYLVQAISAGKNMAFFTDSLVFYSLYSNLKNGLSQMLAEEKGIRWLGYPAYRLYGISTEGVSMELRSLLRGNRFYTIWYFTSPEEYRKEVADKYFEQFKLLPYQTEETERQSFEHFKLLTAKSSPAEFEQNEDGTVDSSFISAYFPSLNSTLTVSSVEIDDHIWAANDSLYLDAIFNKNYKEGLSSKVKTEFFQAKDGSSLDVHYYNTGSHHLNRKKLIKRGKTLYFIAMQADREAMELPFTNKLFDSLVFQGSFTPFDLTKQSARAFFEKIDTAGADGFSDLVYKTFGELIFYKSDKAILFEKGLNRLEIDSLTYGSLNSKIWNVLEDLADDSDVEEISSILQMQSLSADVRESLLTLLTKIGTTPSLKLFKTYFPELLESDISLYPFVYTLSKNKEAAGVLFPDWLSYVTNEKAGPFILSLYRGYADSGFVELKPADYSDMILTLGKKLYQKSKEDGAFSIAYPSDFIDALTNVGNPEAISLLYDFSKIKGDQEYIAYLSIEALLGLGERPAEAIEQMAASRTWRSSIFDLLKDKQELFPKKYATQAAMAEAYLWDALDEDYADTLIFIGTREVEYLGKKARFFLYKLGFQYEEQMEYYMGISGPFDLDAKSLALNSYSVNGMVEDEFDKKKIEKQFQAYLKEMETYYQPQEDEE